MLDSEQQKSRPSDLLDRGISLLNQKKYEKASTTFVSALEKDHEKTVIRLKEHLTASIANDDPQATLCLGNALLKKNSHDVELLNTLGNAARKIQNFNDANQLYCKAIEIDRSYQTASQNLAASLAKTSLFDQDVPKALIPYQDYEDYILPPFANNFVVDPSRTPEEVLEELRQAIKGNWKSHTISEGRQILQNDIYNLGLYALSQQDYALALDNFKKLHQQKCSIFYLEMLLLIAMEKSGEDRNRCLESMAQMLERAPQDRYLNINIAIMYRTSGNQLLADKHFLICDALLKRSEGFFDIESLIKAADLKAQEKDYKTALRYYQTATHEIEDLSLWEKTANLHFRLNDFVSATEAFQKVLELDPGSTPTLVKLQQIYQNHLEKARFLKKSKKLKQTVVTLEKALEIKRPPELLEEAERLYRSLGDAEKADALKSEHRAIRAKLLSEENERKRQALIQQGVDAFKRKEFISAIENLEMASEIKLDKDVFVYLAHVYKDLKRPKALRKLLKRWHQINNSEPTSNTPDE